jgi:hypothetical protein
MLQSHERLKKVFDGHVERLVRRFKLSPGQVYSWMRDTEGTGTGQSNPLDRVRDLIDQALLVDPTGEGARLIAKDSIEYYESLVAGRAEKINPKDEVNSLVTRTAQVVCALNESDVENMGNSDRKELAASLSALCCAAEKIGLRVGSKARLFVAPGG